MNILLLNIPFSKKYSGIEDNSLNEYEKFFKEKKGNNPEFYNFQDYNSYCYGYVSVKEGIVNLSNIDFTNDETILFNNCLIIWVNKIENTYKLVGWYKDATAYKYLQKKISYPSVGRDLYFNVKAKSKNVFLLKPEDRTIKLDIKFKEDSNIIFTDTSNQNILEVLDFIENYKYEKFNIVYNENILNETIQFAPNNPITLAKRGSIFMYNENNYLEAIKFFNTALLYTTQLNKQEILNIKYEKAICLQMLNCFDYSIKIFNEILNISTYNFNICKNLMYLYFVTEDYKNATIICNKIIENESKMENNKSILNEIKCLKAESLIYQNKLDEAKTLLNNVLNNTEVERLKIHCNNILQNLK